MFYFFFQRCHPSVLFVVLLCLLYYSFSGWMLNAAPIDVLPRMPVSTAENVELLGHIGGRTNTVDVVGTLAYVGEGPKMTILDISTPANPTVVGKTTLFPDLVEAIKVVDTLAYLAIGESGIRIVDVTDPLNPTQLSVFDTPGNARDVFVSGNTAYVADGSTGLLILNVTDPLNPTQLGVFDTPVSARGIFVSGNTAYVADGYAGDLHILNVTDSAHPTQMSVFDTQGSAYNVFVSGNTAYVAADLAGLQILNVADPLHPTQLSLFDTPGYAWGIFVSGNTAYVAEPNAGLQILNVADPLHPTQLSLFDTQKAANNIIVNDNKAYVANSDAGLLILNVVDPVNPVQLGLYRTPANAMGILVSGNRAYVADTDAGLHILNVTDPFNPAQLSRFSTASSAKKVFINDNTAYMAGWGGMTILDVSNPANPIQLGHFALDLQDSASDIFVSGTTAYLATYKNLRILNVADPTAPTQLGFFDTPGSTNAIFVSGHTAYVAAYAGLLILNVADPTAPTQLGFFDTPGSAYDVFVSGRIAYVADYDAGLSILDVSDPANPIHLGVFDTPGYAWGIFVSGNTAYVADWSAGLRILNVADPANPAQLGIFDIQRYAYDVFASSNTAYVAYGDAGLYVLRYTTPTPTWTPTPTPTVTPTPTYTHTPTPTPTRTPTSTPTSTPTYTPTPTDTPTLTPTPTSKPSDEGDSYESDNTCAQASALSPDGSLQLHTFHAQADADWVQFPVTAGAEYLIEVGIPPESPADVVLELYNACDQLPLDGQDYTFSPGVRMRRKATTNGAFWLQLVNHETDVAGEHVRYELTVRNLSQAAQPGAVIIVAGKIRSNDAVEPNIYHVTDMARQLFINHDYTDERIYYLAPDRQHANVDALATTANLEAAITVWAVDKVGSDRALTLYLMDHGDKGYFYLDKQRSQWVTPAQLNQWLNVLEAKRPGVKINIIIEACYAGSFIHAPQSLSKPGRVILTSTNNENPAWASRQGAHFSDHLLGALHRGESLYNSFREAQIAARVANRTQTAWLDGDGNGQPEEANDLFVAAQRGFAFAGTLLDDSWPPYIAQVQPPNPIENSRGQVRADVRDDVKVADVWAIIYPPSYVAPTVSDALVQESLQTIKLLDQGNGWYGATYPGFDEIGSYRIVVFAEDEQGVQARPVAMDVETGSQLFLPLVTR